MKYRGRTEILGNILDAANGGATKTKIMLQTFLSYGQLKGYLFVLVENNLIEYLDGVSQIQDHRKRIKLS